MQLCASYRLALSVLSLFATGFVQAQPGPLPIVGMKQERKVIYSFQK